MWTNQLKVIKRNITLTSPNRLLPICLYLFNLISNLWVIYQASPFFLFDPHISCAFLLVNRPRSRPSWTITLRIRPFSSITRSGPALKWTGARLAASSIKWIGANIGFGSRARCRSWITIIWFWFWPVPTLWAFSHSRTRSTLASVTAPSFLFYKFNTASIQFRSI